MVPARRLSIHTHQGEGIKWGRSSTCTAAQVLAMSCSIFLAMFFPANLSCGVSIYLSTNYHSRPIHHLLASLTIRAQVATPLCSVIHTHIYPAVTSHYADLCRTISLFKIRPGHVHQGVQRTMDKLSIGPKPGQM